MPIKILPGRIRRSRTKILYLCVLDNLRLDCDQLCLKDFTLHRHPRDELIGLLRGSSDPKPDEDEMENLRLWSSRVWIHHTEYAPALPRIVRRGRGRSSALEWAMAIFLRAPAVGTDAREPFRELLRALNLLKPSDGPVWASSIFLRPLEHFKKSGRILSRDLRGIVTDYITDDGVDWREFPVLAGFRLKANDARPLSELQRHLSRLNNNQTQRHAPDSTYLRIAVHFFERADEKMVPFPENFQCIDPLLSYEACIEALLIEEDERGVEDLLAKRLGALIPPPSGVAQDVMANFIRRVFVLRSKAAHGVWPVGRVSRLIYPDSKAELNRQTRKGADKTIPKGPYSEMFAAELDSQDFPGFLVNLREVARRAVRFFLQQHVKGRSKKEILHGIDRENR